MSQKDETISKSSMYFEGLLPGNIYRTRDRAFAVIMGTSNNEEESRQIDKTQLVHVARKVLQEWAALNNASVDHLLLSALDTPDRSIEVISPDSIYVEPFPMMLQCDRCGHLDYYRGRRNNEDLIKSAERTIRHVKSRAQIPCSKTGCPGHMKQFRHIAVHRCGKLEPITIPHAARDVENLGYQDRGGTFAQSRFVNLDNNQQIQSALQLPCYECSKAYPNAQGTNMRGTPVDNPEKFYAKNIQYLCLKKETGEQVSRITRLINDNDDNIKRISRDLAEAIASVLIGLSSPDALAEHMCDLLGGKGPDRDNIDILIETLEKKRIEKQNAEKEMMSLSPELRQKMLQYFDNDIMSLENQLSLATGRFSNVRHYINQDDILHNLASNRRSMEATLMPYDFSHERQSLPEMIRLVQDPIRRDQLSHDMAVLNEQYGISEIAHYKEINVVMASLGYTREKPGPVEGMPGEVAPTVLMGYEDRASNRLKGKRIIYGLPARTEALHLRFDPCLILQWWVKAAGHESPGDDILKNPVLAKAHLLTCCPALTMEPSEVISATREQPLLESAPFHLLHTISHCLLGTIKRHTGYDEKSVMEYLLPMDLSIILYVTSVQNYTAGGLLTLFKHYLRDWFDDASNYAFNCIFDPICSDKGSSCSGCVQIVIGCETFNHGLSRSYIHGGKVDSEQQLNIMNGFWS